MLVENKYKRIETSEVIRALELRLNQSPLIKSDRYYFNCPNCNKEQHEHKFQLFNITADNLFYKCFSCDFSGNLITLAKYLNIVPSVNSNVHISTVLKTKEIKPIISLEKLTEILTLFFDNSLLTEKHKNQYVKKRDSQPDIQNTFSFNPSAYNLVKKKYGKELTEKIFYHVSKGLHYLNDCLLFTVRDINNNIISYESKRYKDKFQRPLKTLGLDNKLPIFLNYINDSIKQTIVCEGIEKAQVINEIFNYNKVLAVSIGGITRHDLILNSQSIKILKKFNTEIIISFDSKHLDKLTGTEEKQAVKLSESLIKKELKAFISFLPRPTDKDIKEHDFDSYFYNKDSIFREKTINDLILNKATVNETKECFKQFFIADMVEPKATENNKRKHKISYQDIKPDKRVFINLNDFRKDTADMFRNAIHIDKNKLSVFKITTGGGKTYSLTEALKNYNLGILCHNKDLVNELNQACINAGIKDIEVIHSKIDTYNNEIDNSSLNDTEKQTLKDNLTILFSKGYVKKAKKLIESALKKQIAYIKPSGNKSIITTHHKALFDPSIFNNGFDAVVIDEDITDKMIETKSVSLAKLKHELKFYNHSNFKKLIEYLIEFLDKTDIKINSIDFTKLFKSFLISINEEGLLYDRFRVSPNQKKIKAIRDINELPDNSGLLLKLIESIKNESTYLDIESNGFTEDKILTLKTLNKFETNHTTIILDATADKEILELCGFKVSNFIDIAIKNDNLEVIQYPEKTYKTGNILTNQSSLDKFITEINEINQPGKELTLFTTKKVSEKIKDIPTAYYGKDDKGINSIISSEMILTPIQVNEYDSIAKAKLLYGDKIKSIDTHYIFERTGYIDTTENKEVYFEAFHFQDPFVDKVYQRDLKVPMRQASGRITRNYDKKVTVHIKSNISLFDYGIRVNKIVLADKSNIDYRQDKTIEASKELRKHIINSLIKDSIIKTNNLEKYISKVKNNGKVPYFKHKNFATFQGKLKVKIPCSSQLGKLSYNIYITTKSTKLEINKFNLDSILLHIKSTFDISDSTFKKLKKEVFTDLKINPYYIAGSKQGLFYSDNETIANQFKQKIKQSYEINHTDNVNIDIGNLTDLTLLYKNRVDEQITNDSFDLDIAYAKYSDKHFALLTSNLHNQLHIKASNNSIIGIKDIDLLEQKYYHFIETNDLDQAFNTRFLLESFTEDFIELNNDIYDIMKRFVRPLISLSDIDANISIRLLDPEINSSLNLMFDPINTTEVSKEVLESIEIANESKSDILASYKLSLEGDKIKEDSFNQIEIEYERLVNRERKAHISSLEREKALRKHLSIVLLKRHRIDKDYLKRIQKWTYGALDVDEYIRRSNYYELIEASSQYINLLIA